MPTDWDDAYANRDHIAGADAYPPRWAEQAAAFRAALAGRARARLDEAYGAHPRERFDLFLPEGGARGLVVFIHGGYWRAFDKSSWSHLAAGPLAHGFAVAMPSYPLCPEVGIGDISRSIARAVAAAADAVPDGPLRLTGHSAGGHLAARMLSAGSGVPAGLARRIDFALPISGLFDLRPLRRTAMNADFRLDAATARAESPALRPKRIACPVLAWVGGEERPAFIEQSAILARDWPGVRVHVEPGRHHFDVIDDLADPASAMCAALCATEPGLS